MTMRPGFMLYFELVPALASLDDREAGRLFKALMAYAQHGELQELHGLAEFAFLVMRPRIDKDEENYREKCRKTAYAAYVRLLKRNGEEPVAYEEWDGASVNACQQTSTDVNGCYTTTTTTPNTETVSISKTNAAQRQPSSQPSADSDTAWVLPYLEERRNRKRGGTECTNTSTD